MQFPTDLLTMEKKLENNLYSDLEEFRRDIKLIISNCRFFNGTDEKKSGYSKAASGMERAMEKYFTARTQAYGVRQDVATR